MFRLRGIKRTTLTGFFVTLAAIAGLLIPASPAQAGTASCKASLSYNMAFGGCTHYGHASRRMWARCQVIGSNFAFSRATAWHWGSNICWGDQIGCGTGYRVTDAWFENGK